MRGIDDVSAAPGNAAAFEEVAGKAQSVGQAAAASTAPRVERARAKERDSDQLEELPARAGGASGSAARSARAEAPRAPAPPLERTVPTVGLAGEARERAEAHHDQCWREYGKAYEEYLNSMKKAFAQCNNLESLRALDPEPPCELMPHVGQESLWENLERAHRRLYEAKVDRGYELLGRAPPGTLQLVLGAKVRAGMVGASVSMALSSQGEVESPRIKGDVAGLALGSGGGGGSAPSAGVGMGKVKVSVDRAGGLQLGMPAGPATAVAHYDRANAKFGGGVAVTLGSGRSKLVSGQVEAKVMFQGLSPDDVRRALEGWLVISP